MTTLITLFLLTCALLTQAGQVVFDTSSAPVLEQRHDLRRGRVAISSSSTASAPFPVAGRFDSAAGGCAAKQEVTTNRDAMLTFAHALKSQTPKFSSS
jgi:hypothetical protein